jgi:hypothetical protein
MVCKTTTCEFNHSSVIQIASSLIVLMLSIAHAGISLLGEVNSCIARIDNQQSSGVVIARVQSYIQSLHIDVEISINQLTSTSRKIGIQPLIKWCQISGCP